MDFGTHHRSRKLPVIFCFAGQGSQYYQMGADLYGEFPVFRQWMKIGDQLVRDTHNFSILEEIYRSDRGISDPFDQLEVTHPGLFLVQYALAKTLQHHRLRPDMLLGISLGEFTAMSLAGMFSFEQALTNIANQPHLYRRNCVSGGMVAVLGPPSTHATNSLLAHCSELVGINSDNHFVLSAPAVDLNIVESELREKGFIFQRLPVPYAFHSRWMDPAATACREVFARYNINSPYWPCWSSCLGAPAAPEIADLLWRIVREPMNLHATLSTLESLGGAIYVDLSPSGTVAALVRQVLRSDSPSFALTVMSPFGGNGKRMQEVLSRLARNAHETLL